ncbi:hypothetical protein ABMA28_005062 [Loxostege sticticalis]|uniref:Glyceraldehyde 3-phosphate dehydrogenase NAD(P) binding domain-containing protein n=1 Tax=Loxostege sticticalis TaxID=481309 RepID=A0ABD0SP71_LOXSC
MVIKLGINGFGRIGRVIFRAGLQNADLEVFILIAAINDPAINVEYICYLIKFDSTHGKLSGSVTHTKDEIFVNDSRIKIFHEKLPPSVPWQTAGVQYVIEASGMFTTLERASGHLASDSVKRVIVTAPSVDVPMVILGVNEDKLNAGQKVISCASSTLYCLAPIVKVLEDSYGVAEGFITSIHAMTPSLKPLDGLCLRGKHWRDHRSIHQNIIPATTGACKALGKIIPRVKDKLSGLAFRVPIVNVSVLDVTIRLSSNTTIRNIIEKVEKASNTTMRNIIKVSKEEAVSSDFIGENHSCILDADSSLQLKPNFFKLVCWYENEYSYACRVIDLIILSEKQMQGDLQTKIALKTRSLKQDMVQQTEFCKKEVLCSASADTGLKTKQRLQMLRKKIYSQSSGTAQSVNSTKDFKKRNEILKIWNDDKEDIKPAPRQNRNSFFHSCVAISPQSLEQIDCIKAHERLEMLKKEFSKMVNITESLLKKSYISNIPKCDEIKIKNEEKRKSANVSTDINVESIKHSCEQFSEIYDRAQKTNGRMFDMGGDHISQIGSKDNNILEKNSKQMMKAQFQINATKKANHELQNKLFIFENIPKEKTTPKEIVKSNQQMDISTKEGYIPSQLPIKLNHEQKSVAKFESTNLSRNIKVQCLLLENEKNNGNAKEKATTERVNDEEKINLKTTDSGFFSLLKRNSGTELIHVKEVTPKFGNVEKNLQIKTLSESTNKNYVDELKKDVIEQDETIKVCTDDSPSMTESALDHHTQIVSSNVDNYQDDDLPKSYLENVNRFSPEHIFTESEHTSKCESPDNTSMTVSNVEVNKHKQDIYDKLDSISGTDSNNSFQIHEKKSQVIDLADLTTSMEDLARLDKLCKIIEISDELSNKLFSALDRAEGIDIRKKKWSFKDLCERIKLDDFCDKVFGKSNG